MSQRYIGFQHIKNYDRYNKTKTATIYLAFAMWCCPDHCTQAISFTVLHLFYREKLMHNESPELVRGGARFQIWFQVTNSSVTPEPGSLGYTAAPLS